MITLQGTVISGEQIGERQGYPTANFRRHILRGSNLTDGVYIARTSLGGRQYRALLVIGVRGKRKQRQGKVELYILSYPKQVMYGRRVRFHVYKKIRPLYTYARERDLIARIKKDIQEARAYRYPHA